MTEQIHIDYIRKAFQEMTTMEDFLELLNYAKPLVYGEDHYAFEMKQITYYLKNRSSLNTPEPQNESSGTKLILRKNVPPIVFINEPSGVYGRKRNAVPDTRYTSFQIKKKSGSIRNIHAPVPGLKAIQTTLGFVLQCIFEPHTAAMGFVRGKSIVDNASIHTGQHYVYNIDLKDFFPSIDQARVWKCLQLKPFNLTDGTFDETTAVAKIKSSDLKFVTDEGETVHYKIKDGEFKLIPDNFGFLRYLSRFIKQFPAPDPTKVPDEAELNVLEKSHRDKVKSAMMQDAQKYILTEDHKKYLNRSLPLRRNIANTIAALCCTEMMVERKAENGEWENVRRNVLPQGAPTSPVITNIICQRLDYLLTAVANRFGLKYSRYADDITFSSMHNVYQLEGDFLKELQRIILEQGFHIKESKTRLQKDGYRKEVTGLLVNEKPNVQQRYIKHLRMWLYYWENYGYDRAYSFFLQQYMADKANIAKGKPSMVNVIGGKLDYLKMVKGEENKMYLKLKARLEKMTGKDATVSKNQIEIEEAEISNTPLMKMLLGLTEQAMDLSEEKIIDVPTKVKTEEKPIPVFHKPKELVALLKNFSVNDSALKYTTHSWDAGRDANMFKDLSEFLSIAKSQYSEFSYALKGLSENLNGKIYNFLFNKEIAKSGWGDINPKKRIYFGWSSPELLEACKNDISLNPEDLIMPEKFQIQRSGKTLQKFKHIIDVFKNEIEVRDENSALLNLILQKHDNYLISFSAPKVSNLENKTFYTDIQWLGKALDLIFEGIQKYPQHPLVEYTVTENNNDRLVLTILHRNSFKNGLSIYDDKLNLKRGDFSTIKDKLRNLCDWCIESEFAEGAYRINYLVSDNENPAYEKIMLAEGFKHILTFYK